ncbi:hypothetical protein KSP39_PZI004306 [Platanthera zijinensis]|uniref:Uncharacterized protein n=1 Tax=Platanthera zijinensis TaxID=2320716 RepID=A0AAP0GCV1_9ASPA
MQIVKRLANDAGALDAFVSIVSGPPWPNPMSLMPKVTIHVLLLWVIRIPSPPLMGQLGNISPLFLCSSLMLVCICWKELATALLMTDQL